MKRMYSMVAALGLITVSVVALSGQDAKPAPPATGENSSALREVGPRSRYSGMYSFLKDGEFVQITVEDEGKVTGFISRYGEEGDKGSFIDQFFRTGKLDGNKLRFATETVQGVWFEFKGTVERGEGKNPGDEAYYVLNGRLTENTVNDQKKPTSHSSEVALRMFPEKD
jgi:hypothetical protein